METIEIINQLKSCNYQCEAGPLKKNTAFIELEKAAQKNNRVAEPSTSPNTTNNTDYTTALRVYGEYICDNDPVAPRNFSPWCKHRLNSKKPNSA